MSRHYNKDVIKAIPGTTQGVEAAFAGLLEKRCNREDTVKPLSTAVFERIERLRAKAEDARQRQGTACLKANPLKFTV